MIPIRPGLASRSHSVALADPKEVAGAVGMQILRDFARLWGVPAAVAAFPDPDAIPPGA